MATRKLTKTEIADLFQPLYQDVSRRLEELSAGESSLLWALRRKLAKTLSYNERGTPMHRRKIKLLKFKEQNGLCAECGKPLPTRDTILDRLDAMKGYTVENTRLMCRRATTKSKLTAISRETLTRKCQKSFS